VLFDKIASVYVILKIYLYFSIGNGQLRETSTVPIVSAHFRSLFVAQCFHRLPRYSGNLLARPSIDSRNTQQYVYTRVVLLTLIFDLDLEYQSLASYGMSYCPYTCKNKGQRSVGLTAGVETDGRTPYRKVPQILSFWDGNPSPHTERRNFEVFHWCTHRDTESRLLFQKWSKSKKPRWCGQKIKHVLAHFGRTPGGDFP